MNRVVIYLVMVCGVVLIGRIMGPSDLYDNDQPKTVAYTTDMVEAGRWLLPRDQMGNAATKPPLYNWLGAPALAMFGPGEFVLKLPSVLAALVVVGLTFCMGRWLGLNESTMSKQQAMALACAAGIIWLASTVGFKHIYLARPDMVLAAALTGAWACATLCLLSDRRALIWPIALWACIALAALAKGPPAVLGVFYVALGAKLLTGRWSAINRTGWWWGLPLTGLVVALWLGATYLIDPEGLRTGMFSDVVEHRSIEAGLMPMLLTILKSLWKLPTQFIARFLPWSLFAVLTLIHFPMRRWFDSAIGPAILWVLIVLGFFMLSPRQRPDYLLPMYGPAAIMAAYWLIVVGAKYRINARRVGQVALLMAVGLCVYQWYFSNAAITQYGQNTVYFAKAVNRVADGQPVLLDRTGYNPLMSLVVRARRVETEAAANWVVRPLIFAEGQQAVLISDPIPGVGSGAGAMGLFRHDASAGDM